MATNAKNIGELLNTDTQIALADIAGSGTRNNTTFLRGDGTFNTAGVSTLAALTDVTVNANNPAYNSNKTPVGHVWFNSTTGESFVLTDATNGANVFDQA